MHDGRLNRQAYALIYLIRLKSTFPGAQHVSVGLAATVPVLLAFNLPPSATVLNQAVALLGWGGVMACIVLMHGCRSAKRNAGLTSLLAAVSLLIAAALVAPPLTNQTWEIALSNAGTLAAAASLAMAGAVVHRTGNAGALLRALCCALVLAGLLSVAIGIVQVFLPNWCDGDVIARSSFSGRAVGNLRQPNHLSTLLVWAAIGAVWLGEAKALHRSVASTLHAVMVFGVVLSASRTGLVGVLILAIWGLLDRRLSRTSRLLLVLSPVIYACSWFALAAWAELSQQVFGGEQRLTVEGPLSTTRYGIWSNTLTLIARHPWTGVGFGEFNFAWTLTPFPGRPVEFFDHTHNLPLHLAVELGIPLAIAAVALLAFALWRAFIASSAAHGVEGATLRAAFMMVLMMALHSQLEYPLWYAYFLLPTALLFGLCLGRPPGSAPSEAKTPPGRTRPLLIAGLLVIAGGFAMIFDYMRVVAIFEPPENAAPLAERIAHGQRSWFFTHHADYAAATTAERPSEVMDAFKRASHYLLDARLMLAWAKAFHESGDTERARHIAQRLREFDHPLTKEFFAACETNPPSAHPKPYQCEAPTTKFDHRDFR